MAAQKLLTTMRHLDRSVDSCTPQEIADIIKFHSKGAAAAGVAAGWVPGAGGAAATVISAGFIWTMYGRINSKIGLTFSKSILKTLASGIATNLAGYLVGSLVLNAIYSGIRKYCCIGNSRGRLLCADFSFRYRLFKDINQYIFCRG